MEYKHLPVMLNECMDALNLKDGGVYFDGTLGGQGHTKEILSRKQTTVIATDLDTVAIENARPLKDKYGDRFFPVHDNFKNFGKVSDELNIKGYDGILLDLGVSSYQLDERARGFSYLAKDEILDMRMDQTSGISAYDVVNGLSEEELSKILRDYGEEKFHRQIAQNIVEARKKAPVKTCGDLVEIVEKSIPAKFKHDGPPSKKTFQSIRIFVNGELSGLYEAILEMAERLNVGGRLAVLTFHSLEDRIIKNAFKYLEADCVCDKSLPVCVCGKKQTVKIITAKPVLSGQEELDRNPRAKSAKLRVCERV